MKINNRFIFTLFVLPILSFSQPTTVFNFLSINSDAQSTGFGQIGAVSSTNYYPVNSIQNPALVSQNSQNSGVNYCYNSLNPDTEISNSCIDLFYSIDSSNTFGLIYNYFDYGIIDFTTPDLPDNPGEPFCAYEFYTGAYYSHTFIKKISLGLKFKYAKSNLIYKTESICFDLGTSYLDEFELTPMINLRLSLGAAIVNIGPKVNYPGFSSDEEVQFFQPTQINAGIISGFKFLAEENSCFIVDMAYQYSKLLVSLNTDDQVFKSYINSFRDSRNEYATSLKAKHQVGVECKYNIKQKGLVAFRAGYYNLSGDNDSHKYRTLGGRIGLFGFFVDYANIKYPEKESPSRWLLNIGFNLNLGNKFRFVD